MYIGLGAIQMFDLYLMYIFIDAKVNHTSLKNSGKENQVLVRANDLNLIEHYMLYLQLARKI